MGNYLSYTAKAGRLFTWLGVINLAILLAAGIVLAVDYLVTAQPVPEYIAGALVVGLLAAVAYLIVGAGLKRHERWATVLGWILGFLALLNFPIGTVIGIFILFYLYKGRGEGAPRVARQVS